MERYGREIKLGPLRVKTVRGEAYSIGGRSLIPVARMVSFGKARATVGSHQISGQGGGFVWIQPLAIVEVAPEGERRIPIAGATSAAVWGFLGLAVAIVVFFAGVRRLAGRERDQESG